MPLPEATQACGICGAPAIWVWPDGVKRCDRHTECDVSETQPSRIPNTTPRLICVQNETADGERIIVGIVSGTNLGRVV